MFLLRSLKQGGLTGPVVSTGVNTQLWPTEGLGCLMQAWGGWDGRDGRGGMK